jgi:ABC-2 type transport system ATP-binding protein
MHNENTHQVAELRHSRQVRETALLASNLSVAYGSRRVLNELELRVHTGEIYALLGGNGAGKSTLLSTFLGFLTPQTGRIEVCGIDPAQQPHAARRKLAYVAENVALYEHLSALENLDYMMALAGNPLAVSQLEAELTNVGIAPDAARRHVGSYSKGMRQRVAIALAMARGAPVLLLDEPTSGLDPQGMADFAQLLGAMRERGKAVLMVTHDLLGAIETADRIGFLADGRLIDEFKASGNSAADVMAARQRYLRGAAA